MQFQVNVGIILLFPDAQRKQPDTQRKHQENVDAIFTGETMRWWPGFVLNSDVCDGDASGSGRGTQHWPPCLHES